MKIKSKTIVFLGLCSGLLVGLNPMALEQVMPMVIAAGLVFLWGLRLVKAG
ncbi:MAG: hypothetical protein IIC99_07645 [Chloroflexi bacterium]|nr:hypothetical protein [Chloroflexota bacterium]